MQSKNSIPEKLYIKPIGFYENLPPLKSKKG